MATTDLLHDDASFRLGVRKNLVVPVWSNTPEVAHIRAFGRALAAVHATHGKAFGVFDVVVAGKPNVGDDTRDELLGILKDPRFDGHVAAHVVLIPGFQGAAVRAFLSTVSLVSRMRTVSKFFGEVREAAAWIAPHLSQGGREAWSARDVLEAVAVVTQRSL